MENPSPIAMPDPATRADRWTLDCRRVSIDVLADPVTAAKAVKAANMPLPSANRRHPLGLAPGIGNSNSPRHASKVRGFRRDARL